MPGRHQRPHHHGTPGRGPRWSEGGRHPGRPANHARHHDDDGPAPRREPPRYQAPEAPPRPSELTPTSREFQGLKLYPFQVAAVDAIASGHSVIVAAPTGSGKTLVADYAIDRAFADGWRVVYTSPIKALSNQKYRDFRARHGAEVGIMTGDVTMNPDARLLVMTTEVFRNTLFEEPERLRDFRFVIHDEVHYLDDAERGTVWEESIINAPDQMRLVALSATIPNVRELAEWIDSVRGEHVEVVEMTKRPVPLDHLVWLPDLGPTSLAEVQPLLDQPFHKRKRMRRERSPARMLDWLEQEKLLPVLFFTFNRKECEALAVANKTRSLLSPAERQQLVGLFDDLASRYESAKTPSLAKLRSMAAAGVAYHHAGMLPVHKEIVERLFTSGLVKMLFATETFALGVNMPARTVGFSSLRKFDGERMDYMKCRDYGQMAGRAGRQGIDSHGLVVAMVDPANDRAGGVRRVLTGPPEAVNSQWNPDYGTILSLYSHMGERVVTTYEKSFAKFQRVRRRGAHGGKSDEERLLAARLHLLKERGYAAEGRLTEKGRFTSRVKGYEIQAAEFRDAGLFERLPERQLAALLLGAVYEPRIDETTSPPRDRHLHELRDEAREIIARWRTAEWEAGLTDLTKEPHFGLSAVLEAWWDGDPLAQVRDMTTASDGDIVRCLRLVLQYARQIKKALGDHEHGVRKKLEAVMDAVNRDEVDARRQLEAGQEDIVTSSDADEDPDAFGGGLGAG
jgi:superfamily II RNA helicase